MCGARLWSQARSVISWPLVPSTALSIVLHTSSGQSISGRSSELDVQPCRKYTDTVSARSIGTLQYARFDRFQPRYPRYADLVSLDKSALIGGSLRPWLGLVHHLLVRGPDRCTVAQKAQPWPRPPRPSSPASWPSTLLAWARAWPSSVARTAHLWPRASAKSGSLVQGVLAQEHLETGCRHQHGNMRPGSMRNVIPILSLFHHPPITPTTKTWPDRLTSSPWSAMR